MNTILNVLLIILFLSFLYYGFELLKIMYFMERNQVVYDFRKSILEKDLELYKKLPSYDEMYEVYWYIWDFSKFLDGRYLK